MATWIPNQPVIFGAVTPDCSCDAESGAQIVDNTDVTQFQFDISPCADAESVIVDTNFNDLTDWTLGSNWAISYNQLCLTGGNVVGTLASSENVFGEDGEYYQVNITVDSISDGSIEVRLGATVIGTISVAGEYTFYGVPTADSSGELRLVFSNNDIDVSACFSEVTAYEIFNQFKFIVKDAATNTYQAQISYANNPSYFTFSKNTLTVSVDWSEIGISNGCYYICLLDPCTNTNGQNIPITITNPGFTGGTTGWTLGIGWTYGSNDIDWAGFINPSANQLSQSIFPTYSLFNNVTIVVTALVGTVDVYFGTSLIGTISSTGTHTFSGTPFGGLNLVLEPSAVGSGTIDSITWSAPAFYEYTCDSQSNTFNIKDYSEDCTMQVNGCNNEDGLGFVFDGSGFSPRLRLEAKLKQAKYANERNVYEDSQGSKKNVYYRRRKSKNFCVDLQPEYIHDFLSLALGFDNFYIDNTAYVVEDDEYNVEYSEANDNLGDVKILVSEKVQNVTNINCTDEENVCSLDGDYLLQDNLGFYITQVDGSRITISG